MSASVPERISFETWRTPVQTSVSEDHLLLVVAAYLGTWTAADLTQVEPHLTVPINSIEALHVRAAELGKLQCEIVESRKDWPLHRDLALVISVAAARARFFESNAG